MGAGGGAAVKVRLPGAPSSRQSVYNFLAAALMAALPSMQVKAKDLQFDFDKDPVSWFYQARAG